MRSILRRAAVKKQVLVDIFLMPIICGHLGQEKTPASGTCVYKHLLQDRRLSSNMADCARQPLDGSAYCIRSIAKTC